MSKKIRMLRTEKGSPDGINIITFVKGKEYIVNNDLASVFVDQIDAAIEVICSEQKEEKMVFEAPSNKGIEKTPLTTIDTISSSKSNRGRPRGKRNN